MTNQTVNQLVKEIKGLKEFKALLSQSKVNIYGINVLEITNHNDNPTGEFHSAEIRVYEAFGGTNLISPITVCDSENIIYRNKNIKMNDVVSKVQKSMRKYMGKPVNGFYTQS